MRTYSKYLVKSLLFPFVAILMILLLAVWLTQSLRIINLIVNQGIDLFTFLKISGLLIPSLSYLLLPIALFISVIFLFHKMNADRELVVLKNSGLSNWDIAKPILVFALMITAINYFISFYAFPKSYREFKDLKTFFKNQYASLLLQDGVFNSQVKGLTVYVDSREGGDYFKGIFVYDARKPNKPVTVMADSGKIVKTPNGPKFELYHGSHQQEDKKTGNVSLLFFDSYTLELAMVTETSSIRYYDANEMFIHEIFFGLTKQQMSQKDKFYAQGHQRIIWPMYTFGLILIGAAILLSGQYNRRNLWSKNLGTACAGIIVIVNSVLFNNMALSNINYVILMYLNIILTLVIGVYIMRRGYSNKIPEYFSKFIALLMPKST